jgi:hypothetical protein
MNPKQGTTLLEQLKMQANSGVCRAFLTDGSTDITDSSRLMVLVHGIHSASEVHEEVAGLRSVKGITTGEDLFLRRREALTPSKLRCEILPSVTTDGDRNINGSLTGVGRICEEVTHVKSESQECFNASFV